jgi:hypothetical protein
VNSVDGQSGMLRRAARLSAAAAHLVTVTVVVGALLLGASACSGRTGGNSGQSGSCASVIRIAGLTYIGGRGVDGAAPVPYSGALLHGTTPPCNDTPGWGSTAPAQPETAYAIAGVPVTDAVVRPGSNEVMLAERLWQQPWAALPTQLQPYVRR